MRISPALAAAALALAACDRSGPPATAGPATPTSAFTPQRPEFEAIARRITESDNEYLGRAQLGQWRAALERPGQTPDKIVVGLAALATHHLRLGEVEAAVDAIERAKTMAAGLELPPELRGHLARARALIYLRQAEAENCVARHNRECCIFPLRGGGVHTDTMPAIQARVAFNEYLQLNPGDVKAKWLLNIVAMALGDYPDAVPSSYRVPPEVFKPTPGFAPFRNVGPELGVDAFNLCGGAIADDFDGDGFVDIVTSTYDPAGPLHLYRSRGDGTFDDRSAVTHADDQLGGLNCIGADYDSDGDVDVLVLRGAWLHDDGQMRNSLLRNDGNGVLTDVTRELGLADAARPTQAAAWADYDNDGDLDLYVVNESREQFDGVSYPAELYRQEADGTFSEVASEAGVLNLRYGKGVTAGDYDDDGDMDFYVSNVGPNRLYRNNGDGTFVDVAPELGMTRPAERSFATWFFDHDNDGDLDLFVAAYHCSVADVAADTVGQTHNATIPCLYRNNGDGSFTDIAADSGLAHAWLPMGANFGDIDNDGWLDLYLTTGEPSFEALVPNVCLHNEAGRGFTDVTWATGLGHLQKGHGVAFADFDQDGDQDIYHQLGGFYPGDRFRNALFKNPGGGGHFLVVDLEGTESNRQGLGARVTVELATPAGRRRIHRAAGSVSSFGGSPRRQEIGLGDATTIESVEVWWPKSNTRQRFENVPLDSRIKVTEGEQEFERLEYEAFG